MALVGRIDRAYKRAMFFLDYLAILDLPAPCLGSSDLAPF